MQFALYWLAIKIGLIGANLPLKLDQDQPTQQLVSRVVYNPYVSILDEYRPSGLLMVSIERSSLAPQYSYSQNAIKELRAGDRLSEAAWLLITIWMLQQEGVGFQPVRQAPPPPHRQLFGGGNIPRYRGKYISSSSLSQKVDNFDDREVNKISHAEALDYIKNKYLSKHITVDGDLRMSDWQTAKKAYHGVCFGINPEDYGAKQSDLHRLNKIGIVKYYQEGGRLPSKEHIKAIQSAFKSFCEDREQSNRNDKTTFRDSPSITFFSSSTRQVVIFKRDMSDLITGYKLHPRNADKYENTYHIGE